MLVLPEEEREILRGDLYELYEKRLKQKGKLLADLFFGLEVLDLCRPFVIKKYSEPNTTMMFKNYFIVSYRNFVRQKLYSLLNVGGLVIGLSCFIFIFFYIQDELSYDRFHEKSDGFTACWNTLKVKEWENILPAYPFLRGQLSKMTSQGK